MEENKDSSPLTFRSVSNERRKAAGHSATQLREERAVNAPLVTQLIQVPTAGRAVILRPPETSHSSPDKELFALF